jgi:hypothetical protein
MSSASPALGGGDVADVKNTDHRCVSAMSFSGDSSWRWRRTAGRGELFFGLGKKTGVRAVYDPPVYLYAALSVRHPENTAREVG